MPQFDALHDPSSRTWTIDLGAFGNSACRSMAMVVLSTLEKDDMVWVSWEGKRTCLGRVGLSWEMIMGFEAGEWTGFCCCLVLDALGLG